MPIAPSYTARGAALGLAIVALTACGSESTAASNAAQGNAAMSAAVSAQPTAATPQAAPAAMALPIEQGIYGDVERGSCVRARRAFFYDGTNYGYVSPVEPGWNDTAYFEINRITRVGPPARGSDFYDYYRGYTLAWITDNPEAEEDVLGLKAEGNGRIRSIAVSLGPKGDMFSEETFQKCTFAQLSPQMQAAIRAERPQLAGGATAAAEAGPAQGSAGFPPIEKGYYAIGVSCAQAIADGGDLLAYLDERRFASFDGGQRVERFESLSGNRYRVRATSSDESGRSARADFVIAVDGRTSFTNVEYGDRYTHCPTAQVPRAIREEWGDLSRR